MSVCFVQLREKAEVPHLHVDTVCGEKEGGSSQRTTLGYRINGWSALSQTRYLRMALIVLFRLALELHPKFPRPSTVLLPWFRWSCQSGSQPDSRRRCPRISLRSVSGSEKPSQRTNVTTMKSRGLCFGGDPRKGCARSGVDGFGR